jgi:hypothetical protein
VKKDVFAILLLVFLSFILLSHLFTRSQLFAAQDYGQGDLTHLNYPYLDFYAKELKSGRLPLWTSYISTGYPLFAEGQFGPLYLPNLILFYLFPTPQAFNLSYLVTFVIASTGMYFYCRHIGISRLACLFSSVSFAFSFLFVGRIITLNVIQVISLTPWVFLLADKLSATGSRKHLILLALLLSQDYLAGRIQVTIYLIIGLIIINIWRHRKNLLLLILACLLSFAFSAVQVLPTIEQYQLSTRFSLHSLGYNYPFSLKDLAYFVYPYFWGDPSLASYSRNPNEGLFWENNIYAGLLPFTLLLVSFLYIKKKPILRPYLFLFLSSLLFSLGWLFFLMYLPPFSLFRMPERALFLTSFSYAVIVGIIFHHLVKKNLLAFALVLLTIVDLFILGHGYNGGIAKAKWLAVPATVKYLQSNNISGRVFSLGNFADWLYIYQNISHGWRGESGEKLLANRAILHPNANMVYAIPSYYGYTPFRTQNINLVNSLIFSHSQLTGETYHISSSSARLLGMENVEYIVSNQDVTSDADDLKLVWQEFNSDTQTTYRIYKNNQFVDLVHPVIQVLEKSSVDHLAEALLDPNFEPGKTAFVLGSDLLHTFSDQATVSDIKTGQQELSFHITSPETAFIVVSNSYYPGWKVSIDDVKGELITTNINSLGVVVPSGGHTIRLFYDPASFKVGALISSISLFGALTVLLYSQNHTSKV